MYFFLVVALAVALFACTFALQNTEVISVKFLAWHYEASRALVLLATFAMGVLCGLLATLAATIKAKLSALPSLKKPPFRKPAPGDAPAPIQEGPGSPAPRKDPSPGPAPGSKPGTP